MFPTDYFYRFHSHTPSETAKRMWFYVRRVGWCACAPDCDITRETFDYQLQYIVRGSGQVSQHGRTLPVTAGSIVFLDLRQEYRCTVNELDPWEILWVHFGGRQSADYFQLLLAGESPVYTVCNPGKIKRLFMRLYELMTTQTPDCEVRASHCITGIFTELVAHRMQEGSDPLSLEPSPFPDAVRAGMNFMESRFYQRLTLDEIAQHVALSPFHYARLFKRATGVSVMAWLLRTRVAQAKTMLLETDLPIRDIAEKCGFADQGYFGKQFKRCAEVTPSEFRALHKFIRRD
ncbi:MAG: helix-turn-helix domain-containing protein [Bacilli bacterium]